MSNAKPLFVCGALPLALGWILNMVFLRWSGSIAFGLPLGILLLALWCLTAYKNADPEGNALLQAFVMGFFGLFMLSMVLYQELILGYYLDSRIGLMTQFFFLPGVSLVSTVLNLFVKSIQMWQVYLAEWAVMFLAAWICISAKKRGHTEE